jgi:hypothetical protein
MDNLLTPSEVVRLIAERYGVPAELVEAILRDYVALLYFSLTGREPEGNDSLSAFGV